MLHRLAGPDLAQGLHVIVKTRTAALEGHAGHIELFFQPTNARAEHKAAAGQEVQTCHLFGDIDGAGLGENVDPRSQANVLGGCGDSGQAQQGVDEIGLGRNAHLAGLVVRVFRLVLQRHHQHPV